MQQWVTSLLLGVNGDGEMVDENKIHLCVFKHWLVM